MKKLQTSLLVAALALNLLGGCSVKQSNRNNNNTPSASPTVSQSVDQNDITEQNQSSTDQLQEVLKALETATTDINVNKTQDIQNWKKIQILYGNFTNSINTVQNYSQIKKIDNEINSQLDNSLKLLQELQDLQNGKRQQVKITFPQQENYTLTRRNYTNEISKKNISRYLNNIKDNVNREVPELKKQLELSLSEDKSRQSNNSNIKQNNTNNNSNIGFLVLVYSLLSIILVLTIIYLVIQYHKKNYEIFRELKRTFEDYTQRLTLPKDIAETLQKKLTELDNIKNIHASINNLNSEGNIQTIISQTIQQYQSQLPCTSDSNQIQLIQGFGNSISQINDQNSLYQRLNTQFRQQMDDKFNEWKQIAQGKITLRPQEQLPDKALDVKNNEVFDSRIEVLESDIRSLKQQLEQANLKKEELDEQLKQLQQNWEQHLNSERNRWQQSFDAERQNYSTQLTQLRTENANINNIFTNVQAEYQRLQKENERLESRIIALQPPPVSEPEALPSEITRLIDPYNQNPSSLGQHIQIIAEVNVDPHSFIKYRSDNKQPLILKIPESGSSQYLIVSPKSGHSSEYFLFPKSNIVSTAQSEVIQALFQCHEYRQTNNFNLKRPAKVWRNSASEQEWRFEEQGKGKLQF
ncbi:hypothetical protein [uncultured Nostoc sp.]|uniref:hypothetical protein n=1 Tax=uncultured Nostoc sp. TaxID=340711 RepID=UPI0035CBE40B